MRLLVTFALAFTIVSLLPFAAAPAAADSGSPGLTLGVNNPGPGGGNASAPGLPAGANAAPVLTKISPATAPLGSPLTLTLTGNNFYGGSIVIFGNFSTNPVASTPTAMMVLIPASALTVTGMKPVAVVNPAPGGGTSSPLAFQITAASNAVPKVTAVNPPSIMAGSGAVTVTVMGTGFGSYTSASIGTVAGTISANAITFNVPAGLTRKSAALAGVITNPAPGGGKASFTFDILSGVPEVSDIAPPAAPAGRTRLEITLTGTNFNAGSQVLFGGTALASHLVSATSLLAVLPASLLTRAGTNAVTVVNSAPGGGTSAPVTFTITP